MLASTGELFHFTPAKETTPLNLRLSRCRSFFKDLKGSRKHIKACKTIALNLPYKLRTNWTRMKLKS